MSSASPIDLSGRQHYLDWLRVGAFVVLIAYHAGMYFVTWDWHIKSDLRTSLFEPAMSLVNPWRLALLFFIAGVALRFALLKGKPDRLLGRRVANLFVALVFGMLVVVAPQAYVELRAGNEIGSDPWAFYGQYLDWHQGFSIITPTWNHLWFLAYLIPYTIVLVLLRGPVDWLSTRVDRLLSPLSAGPALLVFALVLMGPFIAYARWLDPLFPTTHMFYNDWATHAHALTAMAMGFTFARSPWFWRQVDRLMVAAPLGAAGLAALLVYIYHHPGVMRFGLDDPALRLLRVVYAWTVIVALLALARRYLNRRTDGLAYLTAAILPFYILHQTVLVVIGAALSGPGQPLWLEVLLMVGGTALVCAATYEWLIRRVPFLSFLFGLGWPARQPMRAQTPAAFRR